MMTQNLKRSWFGSLSLVAFSAIALSACSSGGNSPAPPPPPPPPVTISYAAPPTYTVNVAIATLTPTVSGNPTTFSVNPALPAGLALNTTTGAISGTPTAAQAATSYQVTASNSGSSGTATLSITVAPEPLSVSYGAPASFTVNVAITPLTPTVTGSPTSFTISPALPIGLTFDTATGAISGTPLVVAAPASYLVTAFNSSGPANAMVTLTVLQTPSGIVYPLSNYTRIRGIPASPIVPTVTGSAILGWTINRALPPGMAFNTSTGVISGTPTTLTAQQIFLITTQNSAGGTDSFTMTITVVDAVPNIEYPQNSYSLIVGERLGSITPSFTNGMPGSWSIDKPLPAGLVFSTTDGTITGEPTAASAQQTYVITAQNSAGSDTFSIALLVRSGPFLDLGHSDEIAGIEFNGNRILSTDIRKRFVLWNATSGAMLRAVYSDCQTTCMAAGVLGGALAAIRNTGGWDLYSSADGAVLARVADDPGFDSYGMIPGDGSYLLVKGTSGIKAYSPSGTLLFSRAGNYGTAPVFAAPGEVRVAKGPAGAQVIETITVPGGAASVSTAFAGDFHSWFLDGERFLTSAGTTVRVYSRDLTSLDLAALPAIQSLGGRGNWYWAMANGGVVRVYAVGSAGTAAETYTMGFSTSIVPSGSVLGLLAGEQNLSIVNLAGASPMKLDWVVPHGRLRKFAAISYNDWVFGTGYGVLAGELNAGLAQRYSHGHVFSIAGSNTRVAIATASGQLLLYDSNGGSADFIDWPSTQVALSVDGSVLGAARENIDVESDSDRTLRLWSLPAKSYLSDFSSSANGLWPYHFSMSDSGDVIAQSRWQTATPHIEMRVLQQDGTELWSTTANDGATLHRTMRVRLSPSGDRWAVPDSERDSSTGTNIYQGGTLTGAAPGWPAGWFDEGRLLVNHYRSPVGLDDFTGADVVNPAGALLSQPALGRIHELQRLGTNAIYQPETNLIIDTSTGNTLWSSPASTWGVGAVAGAHVFFTSGATVRMEAR